MNFKKFIFSKLTIIAIIFAAIYQLIMAIVYIPGYETFDNHTDRLKIALITSSNKSQRKFEKEFTKKLQNNADIPHVVTLSSHDAQKQVQSQKMIMAIKLPSNITNNIKNNRKMQLKYYVYPGANQTVSRIASTIETSANTSLEETLTQNQNIVNMVKSNMVTNGIPTIQETIKKEVTKDPTLATSPKKLAQLKVRTTKTVTQDLEKQAKNTIVKNVMTAKEIKVPSKTIKISQTLGAVFLALGCFISVMTASMLLLAQFKRFVLTGVSKWKALAFYEVALIVISITSPIISILIFKFITNIPAIQALAIFGQHVLLTFISSQIVSIPAFLIGQAALLVNLPLALVQTLISGAIMPYNLLPEIYQFLYHVLPIPPTYEIDMSILTGVTINIANNELKLGLIAIGAIILLIFAVGIRSFKGSSDVETITTVG